jgi:nitrous oxidase accessory protein
MSFRFFILISTMIFGVGAHAETIEVCASCPIKTVHDAVSLAQDGDRIFVKAGKYSVQKLIIEKALEITGEEGTIIDGGGMTIFYVQHDSVSMSNLELQNVETNYVEDRAALKFNDSDYLNIKNIRIRHSFFGILIEKSKHGRIEN